MRGRVGAVITAAVVAAVVGGVQAQAHPELPAGPAVTLGVMRHDHSSHLRATDRPEAPDELQGRVPPADQLSGRSKDGYWHGMRLVGQHELEGQGAISQLAWSKNCAYVAVPPKSQGGGRGVAVLDVSNPAAPQLTEVVREAAPPVHPLEGHEGLKAHEQRGILVVPAYSSVAIFDIKKDCRHPVLRSRFDAGVAFPGIHSGQISPDGNYYYATSAYVAPCVTIIDIRNLDAPRVVTSYGDFACHDLGFNEKGDRAYLGWTELDSAAGAFVTGPGKIDDENSGTVIVDISEILNGRLNPEIRELSRLNGGRYHTQTRALANGRALILGTEESTCPGGNGRIVDVTDDLRPFHVADATLEVNMAPGCFAAQADGRTRPYQYYTTHNVSVDNDRNARLAFFSWFASGLRVFDISDPAHPQEVAYYNPPVGQESQQAHDFTTSLMRYDRDRGHIWFVSTANGFQVVELDEAIRP